jgi:hypothetical protein
MEVFRRASVVVVSTALLLALGACDQADDRSAGERAEAGTTQKGDNSLNRENAGASADGTGAMGAGAAEKVDDGAITARINVALAADEQLSAMKIDVDTQNGVVTLSGPVPTATAKEHAGEVARSVKGVTLVNNQLTLKTG